MLKKLSVITPVVFALASILSLVSITQPVSAEEEHIPVTICHRDTSAKKPYVQNTVDDDSVDGIGGSDHYGQHTGPLADSVATATTLKAAHIKWGDIIPPVGNQPGLNWTTEGQAIWGAGCVVPGEEEEFADISFGVVCSADGALVTLVNEGNIDGEVIVNGEVITIAADETVERTIATTDAGVQITITIDDKVVYDELVVCDEGDVLGDTDTPTTLPNTSGNIATILIGAIAALSLIAGLASLAVRSALTRQ